MRDGKGLFFKVLYVSRCQHYDSLLGSGGELPFVSVILQSQRKIANHIT